MSIKGIIRDIHALNETCIYALESGDMCNEAKVVARVLAKNRDMIELLLAEINEKEKKC